MGLSGFSKVGVCVLQDLVVADPTGPSNVTHITGHVATKATLLTEEAYFASYPRDLFYLLALEFFGNLHPIFHHFLQACVASRHVSPSFLPSLPSLGNRCSFEIYHP